VARVALARAQESGRPTDKCERVRAEEWRLIEWTDRRNEPDQLLVFTLSEDVAFEPFVASEKVRGGLEPISGLKQELGLGI